MYNMKIGNLIKYLEQNHTTNFTYYIANKLIRD